MSEILVYNTSLSLSDRQSVEGYLAWKWGLQTTLPLSHPYYLFPPPFPRPIIQYVFNSLYVSSNYLKNLITGAYDLNLQSATISSILGKNSLKLSTVTNGWGYVSTSVTNNSAALISSSTTFTAITITLWAYRTTTQQFASLFQYLLNSNQSTLLYVQVDTNKIVAWINTSPGVTVNFGALPSGSLNLWTLILRSNGGYLSYFNNNTSATSSGTLPTTTFLNTNRDTFQFGKSIYGDPALDGYIADFRVYGTELTQTQIASIYSLGASNT